MIIPKHLFGPYIGEKSREAPHNMQPIGTGPYRFKSFTPAELVKGVINPNYHQPNRPYFDAVEMKGGGDAISAARAVLQTGEYDYAWNVQVQDDVLERLEVAGKGRTLFVQGANVEHIQINFTDPWTEVDGERASIQTTHPTLSDPNVRHALALLVDRGSIQKHIYGRSGQATANYLNGPPRFVSTNTSFEFNLQRAITLLEQAGWKTGSDGIRAKDGRKLQFVFQSSINQPRQQTQQIIKRACQQAGIEVEIKPVVASVFFSSDVANPDTPHISMPTCRCIRPDHRSLIRGFGCDSFCPPKSPAKRISGKGAILRGGGARNTIKSLRRLPANWIRSNEPQCSFNSTIFR